MGGTLSSPPVRFMIDIRMMDAHTSTELKLRGFEEPGGEAGGTMLNIAGLPVEI